MADELTLPELRIPKEVAENVFAALEAAGLAVAQGASPSREAAQHPRSPLVVFVNGRSGGRLGPDLLRISIELLSSAQVFDLHSAPPDRVMPVVMQSLDEQAAAGSEAAAVVRDNLRILVAGGDGTVDWLLSVVEQMATQPPVAIIPLGTGNNLSRYYGWGAAFVDVTEEGVKRRLLEGATATVTKLDSWLLTLVPSPNMNSKDMADKLPPALHKSICTGQGGSPGTVYTGSFYNYFNCGMFAEVACAFHNLRNSRPHVARHPLINKLLYASYECTQGWFCASCSLSEHNRCLDKIANIKIQRCLGGPFEDLPLRQELRGLMFLNVPSYVGGRDPWGTPTAEEEKEHGWGPASGNDSKLEILGLTDGWHSLFMLGKVTHGIRLAQAYGIRMELRGEHRDCAFLHLDGKPWQQELSKDDGQVTLVEITQKPRQALLLSNSGAKALLPLEQRA